jgi:SpoIID/LytB domain protein
VLADGARILSTVFHANSGGWTANNDTVWSAPPDPALRAVSDLMPEAPATAKKGPALYGIGRWITEPPPSYAGAGERSYRWERRYGARELSRLVNARFPIGPLERIVLGERGPSGRLKWVRLAGAKSTETVFKDYPIREALGGLPSSMFIVDRERGASGEGEYVFRGGGRGHGVGLCQYGAKGRAEGGADYQDILLHYYRNGTLETLE